MAARIIILTSTALRHKYFANSLAEVFDVISILAEEKDYNPSEGGNNSREQEMLYEYFSDREKSEEKFFGYHRNFGVPEEVIIRLPSGTINVDKSVDRIIELEPEFILVFGTSIIKEKLIKTFPRRIINMHLGLSPYYRGSGTNFWALYDSKPECVGVTIHLLDEGVDSGAVIVQGRPSVSLGDTPHDLGNKTIIKGVDLMIETLQRMSAGPILSIPQKEKGKLCLRKHFTADHLALMLKKIGNGLIDDYVAHKDTRDNNYPIIEWRE